MGAQSNVHLHNVPSHKLLKSRTTLTASIWQIEGGRLFSVGEAIEAIFTDQDSDNDSFDCGSDVEYCPDSEDVSANEEMTWKMTALFYPLQSLARMVKLFQMMKKVIVLPLKLCRKFAFLDLANQKICLTCFLYIYIVLQANMSQILTYNLLHLHLP